ncbi:MAG: GumC family protein [Cyclobacteriaceae bacterium]
MNPEKTISQSSADSIDFNKLKIIARTNFLWIILIVLLTNFAAYFYLRYTKDMYESVSEIKLDVKQDATELGIRELVPERQNVNLISAEIETIKSKLFLSSVIDSLNLYVSYYSIGKILNTELHVSSPFIVDHHISNPAYYDNLFLIEPTSENRYRLRLPTFSATYEGEFGKPLSTRDFTFTIRKKTAPPFDPENQYSFVVNSKRALLDYILNNLTVEPLNINANTIRVSFRDSNPFKAQDLVNGIDSIYLLYSNEQKNLANLQKITWLNNELSQIEQQMGQFEDYFENFTLKNKTSNLNDDLKRTIMVINKIDSQRFETNRRINEVNRLMDALAGNAFYISASQRSIFPEYVNKNIEKLQELYLDIDKLKLSYSENTFAFRQKGAEIESIRKKVYTELAELKADLLKRMQDLTKSKASLENEFASMPDKNTQFSKKARYYKLYEELYLTLMQRKSEFEIAKAGSTPDFKILSTADLPQKPISPQRLLIHGIGFVAGIVLSLLFVGILYLANDKITNVYEVERSAGVPLLGVVPAFRGTSESGVFIINHPKSMVSEAIRTLRTNLDFFSPSTTKKIIAISSTVSGEGKSFLAMNLGGIVALSKKKVVLLDLDMRKPKVNQPLNGSDPNKGVSTILIRKNTWQECLSNTPVENLDFIPSGPHPPNPAELLLNGEFTSMLSDLREKYDFIILDTPPVGLVTDGIMAMKHADVSVYVFRANYSRKEFIHNLQRIVRINKFNNITAVVNALPATSETAYGYGYYEDRKTNRLTSIFKRSV